MISQDYEIKKAAGSGLLVALWVPEDTGRQMAIQNGEPHDSLHVTLAYMGKDCTPEQRAQVMEACNDVAQQFGPVQGSVGGMGRFCASESSDGEDVYYASYDSPDINMLRQALVENIQKRGVPVKQNHGYTPHITLAYMAPEAELPSHRLEAQPLAFQGITVTGGPEDNTFIPFGGQAVQKSVDVPQDQLLALEILGFKLVEKDSEISAKVKILKEDDEQRLVYGVVLEPLSLDTQGHIMTPDDVQYAAHHYMGSGGVMGDKHKQAADAVAVESYVAPVDFEMGGQKVLKGSWVLVSYVRSDSLWAGIKSGAYTGYSVGGFGALDPI